MISLQHTNHIYEQHSHLKFSFDAQFDWYQSWIIILSFISLFFEQKCDPKVHKKYVPSMPFWKFKLAPIYLLFFLISASPIMLHICCSTFDCYHSCNLGNTFVINMLIAITWNESINCRTTLLVITQFTMYAKSSKMVNTSLQIL